MSFTEKVEVVYRGSGNGGLYRKNCGFDRQLRNRMSYTETVEVVYRESGKGTVVKRKLVVVIVNGKSGCCLQRKRRSFTEEVGMVVVEGKLMVVVVNRESGCHLRRKWRSFMEEVDVVYGESGGRLWRKW